MTEPSFISLIPPLLTLLMIILTRRVILSLGAGIVIGGLILNDWSVVSTIVQITETAVSLFYVDGAVNDWEFFIMLFLLFLGMMAALITFSGGSRAFGEWALSKVKTRIGAQLATLVFGILVFIDDYFNSLTVGQVSRPLTDRHKVSRAKLAYIVDSAAAPICVIAPLSSWGAYIITIIAGILADHGLGQYGALEAFIYMIPMNFYALTAILFVFLVIVWKLNFGPMRTHESRAIQKGVLFDSSRGAIPGDHKTDINEGKGSVIDLLLPIAVLIVGTVVFMIITGIQGTEGEATALTVFAETDVASSLVYGGLIGLSTALLLTARKKPSVKGVLSTLGKGIQSMLPAIYILIFAWTMVTVIDGLGTGEYLAGVLDGTVPAYWLPALLFLLAGFMAFSTGTSWGTFILLLPIAGDIAAALDITMMLPVLAAVLAGAIFGDHCSPISDTTILSSTGAGSHHIDHVLTQLPYALVVAAVSFLGYLVLGLTGSTLLGLTVSIVLLILAALMLRGLIKPIDSGSESSI
ncbi:Na+/H+ antiporter NhaC family protein [Bacillus sp. FJAT-44742]|uniref:Na+/H+ antiporter NhaC family protein n=1 Tax=Bacillus sp. FJAT-44742 TaxID=2014005 RepID=UPI0012FF357C|nr:Na+/H+ antiporter NhaC family protein [Bacillus sp. FJAT-44742]